MHDVYAFFFLFFFPHALHRTALHPPTARYPWRASLSVGATGAESICTKDSPLIGATGAAHLQLRLNKEYLATPFLRRLLARHDEASPWPVAGHGFFVFRLYV
jgi:hypothetical protein